MPGWERPGHRLHRGCEREGTLCFWWDLLSKSALELLFLYGKGPKARTVFSPLHVVGLSAKLGKKEKG